MSGPRTPENKEQNTMKDAIEKGKTFNKGMYKKHILFYWYLMN